jgi:trigger factor
MQVTELSQSGLKREFKVVVNAADIAEKVAGRLAELGREASLPGFRPGKVPLPVLRKRFGNAVLGEVLQQAVSDSSTQALAERGMRPAMQPRVEVTSFAEGTDLEYKLAFEMLPDVKPMDFKTLELERVKVQIDDDEIEKALARLAEQRAKSKAAAAGRPAQKGDIVVIDFTGRVDGKEFAGGAAKEFRLELGSAQFVPGFEDQLVGATAGDKRNVEITFPADYGNDDLKGKQAVFDVVVGQVLAPSHGPIDEAVAKEMGFDDLASLRKAVSDQIGREYGELARLRTKRQLLDKLAAAHDFAVPEGMTDLELDTITANLEREREAGLEDESTKGKSVEAIKAEFRPIAERRVRLGLLLSEVGRANNIQVSQEETNRALVEHARRYPGQERKVVDHFRNNPEALAQLRGPLFEEKVIDFIMEMAKTSEVSMSVEALKKAQSEDETKT